VNASVEVVRSLDEDEVDAVSRLVERTAEADGHRPLSEHVMLHLRYGGDVDVRHVLLWHDDGLVGYAHLDVTDAVEGASAEIAVDPAHRGQGIGRRIVEQLQHESPDGRLRLWAHGELVPAARLARRLGFTRGRVLWQMRRSLFAAMPAPAVPDGIAIRTFEPSRDAMQWLRVNAAAFADHPDQASWTSTDLANRMREPWFDPHGFFIAERTADGAMVGFHWTKVHGGRIAHDHDGLGLHAHEGHGHDPIGEIYVIGVLPDQAGRGLGRALALVGLAHLRALGLPEAMLYVEADNAPAIALYESLGFTHWDTDVMYTAPGPRTAASG
jgi:mycothiol synthase